jgi:hypothetical protein
LTAQKQMMRFQAGEYFDLVVDSWRSAELHTGASEQFYEIADLIVRIQFSGAGLLDRMAAPFAHLECKPPKGEPHVTIRVWDASATGIAMPPPPCDIAGFTARGEFKGFCDGRYDAAYEPPGRILSVYDAEQSLALVCIADSDQLPTYLYAAPLRPLLGWIMSRHQRQLIHAASVGTRDGGVIIAGAGGAGKSNTALGSLRAGLSFVSDDFCAVSLDCGASPVVHSLYCSSRTHVRDWATLPFPRANPKDPPSERDLHYLQTHFADRIVRNFPIRAMIFPRKVGDHPALRPISAASVIVQIAAQSASMLPNAGGEVLSRLTRILGALPTYQLDLGVTPTKIPIVIQDLIEKLGRAGGNESPPSERSAR